MGGGGKRKIFPLESLARENRKYPPIAASSGKVWMPKQVFPETPKRAGDDKLSTVLGPEARH